MPKKRFAIRRNKLLREIKKSGADALLVSGIKNVTYLTGFSGDSSYLILGPKLAVIISDSRYTTQIEEECNGIDVLIRKRDQPMLESVSEVTKKAKLKKLGFESHLTSYRQWEQLQSEIKHLELVGIEGSVESLRKIKDAHEIQQTREAVYQAEKGFALLKASLHSEMTELQAAHELEHAMRKFGGEKAAFDPIVAVGPRAALPHARPTHQTIGSSDFILIDWGSQTSEGYKSDLTRVLTTGKILPKLEKIYKVVLKAQLQAIKAIRPGAICSAVDASARSVIEKAGYGKYFGHGLGHGIGLDIHEETRLSAVSHEVLKPGMIITVEPGIYLPGWGGVRIEDDVLVTRDGHEVLSSVPKQFEESVIR